MKSNNLELNNQLIPFNIQTKYRRIKMEYKLSWLTYDYLASIFNRSKGRISQVLRKPKPNMLATKIDKHLSIIETRQLKGKAKNNVCKYPEMDKGIYINQ